MPCYGMKDIHEIEALPKGFVIRRFAKLLIKIAQNCMICCYMPLSSALNC